MKLIYTTIIMSVLFSCGMKEENTMLQSEVDSLRAELNISNQAINVLDQVGMLMDTIDKARDVIYLDVETGIEYEDFVDRMEQISDYVRESEEKLKSLEIALEQSKGQSNRYYAAIRRLKEEIEQKNAEIMQLESTLAELKLENTELITTIDLQNARLTEKEMEIMAKTEELELLETRIVQMRQESRMSEAEIFYSRGQAWEVAADRTFLSRRKKQDALNKALKSYKQALSLGMDSATVRISAIEEALN